MSVLKINDGENTPDEIIGQYGCLDFKMTITPREGELNKNYAQCLMELHELITTLESTLNRKQT